MRKQSTAIAFALITLGCTGDSTDPEAFSGFSGTWQGGESSGAQRSGTIQFTVTGGVNIAGEVSPISGSQRQFTGDIEDGAILAVIPATPGGCEVTLNGSIAFANDGTGAGTASGTYKLTETNSCNTNKGTWSATKPPK